MTEMVDPKLRELVTMLCAVGTPERPVSKTVQRATLLAALNGAVTLEFATIPTYLLALWTIRDELHPVAKSLRNILQEEMLHMALVCNMLVSLGGTPAINSAVPAYPGHLPLGVHPDLTVPLARFSKETLKIFMEIERPGRTDPKVQLVSGKVEIFDHEDSTIGQLYAKILDAFKALNPEFKQDRQITGPLSWLPILSLADVEAAINIIERQGEGSVGEPEERRGHLAHYFRFAEMFELNKLRQDKKTKKWAFSEPIAFSFQKDVWPMADIPAGGYVIDPSKEQEAHFLHRSFNLIDCFAGPSRP